MSIIRCRAGGAFIALALGLLSAAFGQAATTPVSLAGADMASSDDSKLKFSVTPYFWATTLSGNVTTHGVTSNLDVDFTDIANAADNLYAAMAAVDLQYGRFVVQFNGSYAYLGVNDLTSRIGPNGGVTATTDVDITLTWLELVGGYRFVDMPIGEAGSGRRFTLDGLAGGRYTHITTRNEVTAGAQVTLPDGTVLAPVVQTRLGQDENWIDPIIGARASVDLSEHWTLSARADVDGFGVGSDFAWQAFAAVGYRFKMGRIDATAFLGYRAVSEDYTNGDFRWDVVTHGPVLGLQLAF